MLQAMLVFLGGGLGSLCRYGVNEWLKKANYTFPWATLLVNVLSSIILGILLGYLLHKPNGNNSLRIFLATGFCGGFSTFSTFSAETVQQIMQGNILFAILNIFANILLCCIFFYCTIKIFA